MPLMKIHNNISLKTFNTFGIDVNASQFVEVHSIEDLKEVLNYIKENQLNYYILGGGSNILFTRDFDGVVVHIQTKGIAITRQSQHAVLVKVSAGENWHDWVMWSLEQGYSGLENLALIPGNVGSSPIQNIGAYGVEVKNVIECVEVMDIETGRIRKVVQSDCQFGYRDSIFKKSKGKYIVTAVNFHLKKNQNQVNTSYGAIQSVLEQKGNLQPTALDIANTVIQIRQSKLPDPKILGNSGSFFKNPVIPKNLFSQLQSRFPEIPHYPAPDDQVKLAAGWLIEHAGYKGKRFGEVGVHEQQALVLVNYGNAQGTEVVALAQKIQQTVLTQFGVTLEIEVNIV